MAAAGSVAVAAATVAAAVAAAAVVAATMGTRSGDRRAPTIPTSKAHWRIAHGTDTRVHGGGATLEASMNVLGGCR